MNYGQGNAQHSGDLVSVPRNLFKLTASSLGSSMLTERVKEDVARSSVLTHEQQGQAVEESANVSQEPHQDCELKNEMIITASKTVTRKSLISLTF